jgi:hypothetical protein
MWHYQQDGEPRGPFSAEDLFALFSQSKVRGSTLVWREGMKKWLPLVETDLMRQFDALMARAESSAAWVENSKISEADARLEKGLRTENLAPHILIPGELQATIVSGARWFYWIAALTVLNLVFLEFKIPFTMSLGLATTRLVCYLSSEGGGPGLSEWSNAVIGLDLLLCCFLCLFGWLSAAGHRAVFIMGTILVAMDSMFYIFPFLSLAGVVVHLYAVCSMYFGIVALGKLQKIEMEKTPGLR